MTKSLQIIPHLLFFFLLGALFVQGEFTFVFIPSFLIIYAVCFIACPFFGLRRPSAFCKVSLYAIGILILCGLIFAIKALLGSTAAIILLAISAIIFGSVLIQFQIPEKTKETEHLEKRGLTGDFARRKILRRQSYAFFFYNSGRLAALIGVFLLLTLAPVTKDVIFSMALHITLIRFMGKLIYGFLDAPMPEKKKILWKKGRIVAICLLIFMLVVITAYVFIGVFYTTKEPALREALMLSAKVLFAAFLGLVCSVLGIFAGHILSLLGTRFLNAVFTVPKIFSAAIFSCILYPYINAYLNYPEIISVCIVLFMMGILTFTTYKMRLKPFKSLPLLNRKKTVVKPLLSVPLFASIPVLMTEAVFSSFFVYFIMANAFTIPAISQIISGVILSSVFSVFLVICILTKEVRHNG